jgi:hypothetical protein
VSAASPGARDAVTRGDRPAEKRLAVDGDRVHALEKIEVIGAVLLEDAHVAARHAARSHDDLVAGGRAHGHRVAVDAMHFGPAGLLADFQI